MRCNGCYGTKTLLSSRSESVASTMNLKDNISISDAMRELISADEDIYICINDVMRIARPANVGR